MNEIKIAAAIIIDSKHRLLLVRKQNTEFFMQPGGKIEGNEASVDCLIRELNEELNIDVQPDSLRMAGTYKAVAVNEPDYTITAELFVLHKDFEAISAAELAEVVWVSPSDKNQYPLAPLTRDYVFPLAEKIASAA